MGSILIFANSFIFFHPYVNIILWEIFFLIIVNNEILIKINWFIHINFSNYFINKTWKSSAVLFRGSNCHLFLSNHCLKCSLSFSSQSPRLQIIYNPDVVILIKSSIRVELVVSIILSFFPSFSHTSFSFYY